MINIEQRVHPDLKALFSVLPESTLTEESIEKFRAGDATFFTIQPSDSMLFTERLIPGPEGASQVPVTIYEPKKRAQELTPGMLFLHGGGYVCGNSKDPCCQKIAESVGCVAVSVDYRRAPENPYPAALEDSYAALKWFSDNAQQMGVDRNKIAVVGASAGGGLAAAVTLLARDRGGPRICFQLLIYPMLDDRNETASSREMTDKRIWNRTSTLTGWRAYLRSLENGIIPEYAAPSRASDLSGLPPAYTFVGELEPFRDEVIDYASRLVKAGVPTEFHLYPGCFHACERMAPYTDIGKRIISEYIGALRNAFNTSE